MSLPNSPSDCPAPFKSPVANFIWPSIYPLEEFWDRLIIADQRPDRTRREYALAQQAEFEYLWLRECASALDDEAPFYRLATRLVKCEEVLTPYLNPPTP